MYLEALLQEDVPEKGCLSDVQDAHAKRPLQAEMSGPDSEGQRNARQKGQQKCQYELHHHIEQLS